jgi:photosystem II stability/assembly factor-like uncharacterized protein
MTFATANDGWLVTDGAAGAAHGLSAIYRTTDGGADWVPVWHGEGVHLSRIGLLPGTPTQIYATGVSVLPGTVGAPDTPLWLTSADGGVSWRVVEATLPESLTPAALGSAAATAAQAWSLLQFSFPTTSVGYAAPDPEYTQGGGALLKTTDGGKTWAPLPGAAGPRPTGGLDFQSATDGWITGTAPGTCAQVWRTTDGGASWQPLAGSCAPFPLYAVRFTTAADGWAAGGLGFPGTPGPVQTGILRTTDGGASWHTVYDSQGASALGPVAHLRFASGTQGWAWGGACGNGENAPCTGTVLVTNDAGAVWEPTSMHFASLVVAGGRVWGVWPEAGVWTSADGGSAWTGLQPPAWSTPCCLASSGGTVWTDGLQTVDSGGMWTPTGPLPAPPPGIPLLSTLWRASPRELFTLAVGSPHPFQVSDNGGAAWSAVSLPGARLGVLAMAFSDPEDGMAVTPLPGCNDTRCVQVDATTDNGRSWGIATTLGLPELDLHAALSSGVDAIVGSTRTGNSVVAISADGGSRWTLSPLPEGTRCFNVDAVAFDVWLTCRSARFTGVVLHSADGGRTWTQEDLAAVPQAVAMTTTQQGFLLAAGFGPTEHGLYETFDGGAFWTEIWPTATPS